MILMDLKDYLSRNRMASLADLSVHFGVEPDAMRGMLEQLICKKRLRKLPPGKQCQGCCGECKCDQLEMYKWQD